MNLLRLVQNITTVATFTTSPYSLIGFTGATAEMRTEELANVFDDGVEVLYARRNNVVDTITIIVGAATQTILDGYVEALEQALSAAAERRVSHGDKIYLEYQRDAALPIYSTEVFYGRIISSEDFAIEAGSKLYTTTLAGVRFTKLVIEITREHKWRRTTLVELPLTNSNGTRVTGGITVWNHDDAGTGHDNWVQIDAQDVLGSIPGPIRLHMKHNSASYSGTRIYGIFVARNRRGNALSFQHVYEAENATLYSGASLVNNVAYSNGQAVAISASNPAGQSRLGFTISSSQLQQCMNRWFRVLGRVVSWEEDSYVTLKVTFSGTTLYTTAPVKIVSAIGAVTGIVDFGAIPLPPSNLLDIAPYPLNVEVCVTYAGTFTGTLDFIELAPAEDEDGFVTYNELGYGIAYDWTLVDDNIRKLLYVSLVGGSSPHYVRRGTRLTVYPNTTQKLFFLWNMTAGTCPIDATMQVRAYYYAQRERP